MIGVLATLTSPVSPGGLTDGRDTKIDKLNLLAAITVAIKSLMGGVKSVASTLQPVQIDRPHRQGDVDFVILQWIAHVRRAQ